MLPCPTCDRHLQAVETTCPFCSAPVRSTRGHRPHAAAIVIAVGSVLVGCGPAVSDAGDSVGSTSSTGGGPASTTGDPQDDSTGGSTLAPATTVDPATTFSSGTTVGDTTIGDSTTWEDDTFDSCGGFYGGCPVDGGVSYECDVFMQDCAEGEKCAPWANDGGDIWNANRCVPVDVSPDEVGDPCTVEGSGVSGVDTCAPTAFCFHVDPKSNEGVCVEMCGGSEEAPECLEGTTCVVQFDGVLPLCFRTCDPKTPACDEGEDCQPVADPSLKATACTPV